MTKTNTQLLISGNEHLKIARRILDEKRLNLSRSVKRKALAAGFGRKAYLEFQENNLLAFNYCLALSLLYFADSKGGAANKLLRTKAPVINFVYKSYIMLSRILNLTLYFLYGAYLVN